MARSVIKRGLLHALLQQCSRPRRVWGTLMLTIASSLYIDKLPLADGENENASHMVLFDNLDVFYFGSLVRARMDGVCQPRRQILVPFPGTTKSKRDHLSIGIRSGPSGARLQRHTRPE